MKNQTTKFGDEWQREIQIYDSQCDIANSNWRPTPSYDKLLKYTKWQDDGRIRLAKENQLTRIAWRNMKNVGKYKVNTPCSSPTESINSRINANEAFERLQVGQVLITDITDEVNEVDEEEDVERNASIIQLYDNLIGTDSGGNVEWLNVEKEMSSINSLSPEDQFNVKIELKESDKKFDNTLESKRRYRNKYLAKEEYENERSLNNIRNRIEQFNKLKKELLRQGGAYRCHYKERKLEEVKKKEKFLNKLANEQKIDINLLKITGDKLYKDYKENLRKVRKLHIEYLNREIKQMNLILEQRCKEIRQGYSEMENKEFILERSVGPVKSSDLSRSSAWSVKSRRSTTTIQQPKVDRIKKKRLKYSQKSKQSTPSLKSQINLAKKSLRLGSLTVKKSNLDEEESIETAIKESPSNYMQQDSKDSIEPPPEPKLTSIFDTEVKQKFQQFDKNLDFITNWREKWYTSEENLPIEQNLIIRPPDIFFESFLPYKVYIKKVSIKNGGTKKLYLYLTEIKMNPNTGDRNLIKVVPEDNCALIPGIPAIKYVVFEPLADTPNLEAHLVFKSRRSAHDIRILKMRIECRQQRAMPFVKPVHLKFPTVKHWSDKKMRKAITVANAGSLPFTAQIMPSLSQSYTSLLIDDDGDPLTTRTKFPQKFPSNSTLTRKRMRTKRQRKRKPVIDVKVAIMKYIIEWLILDVLHCVRFYPKYNLKVPPYDECKIIVEFAPQLVPYTGSFLEQYLITFQGVNLQISDKLITIESKTEEPPLKVEPISLDLQVCLPGGGAYQAPFMVRNEGYLTYQVLIKVPRTVANHICVEPNTAILNPHQAISVLVRFAPKWSFILDAAKFYDAKTKVFEMPILITSRDEDETGPPVELHVIGLLGNCMSFELLPKTLDLGIVHTNESVLAKIYLTNHSPVSHIYGFVNTPKCLMVAPSYGYGLINNNELLKLDIIYSPGWELLDYPGQIKKHIFYLRCTTADRLACEPSNVAIKFDETDRRYNFLDQIDQEVKPFAKRYESTEFLDKNDANVKRRYQMLNNRNPNRWRQQTLETHFMDVKHTNLSNQRIGSNLDLLSSSGMTRPRIGRSKKKQRADELSFSQSEESNLFSSTIKKSSSSDMLIVIPEGTAIGVPEMLTESIRISAIIVDPICELSAQRVIMWPTPYYSYSMITIDLRAPNRATLEPCYCGLIKNMEHYLPENLRAHYEFFSNRPQLSVEPCKGRISIGDNIKVYLILRPVLKNKRVIQNAKRLKALKIEEEMREKYDKGEDDEETLLEEKNVIIKAKVGGNEKKKNIKKNATLVEVAPPKLVKEITSEDILASKLNLLKTLEPTGFIAKVTCLIQSDVKDEESNERKGRNEVLKCSVYCPIITPNILVATPQFESIIDFGLVAIGVKSKQIVQVHNTSGRLVYVNRTLLDTDEVFYSPFNINVMQAFAHKGIMLEPDHTLDLPIYFGPIKTTTIQKFFEVSSGKTVIPLKLIGRGVTPVYNISLESRYALMKAKYTNPQTLDIIIENECEAPLPFQLRIAEVKEGLKVGDNIIKTGQESKNNKKKAPVKSKKKEGRNIIYGDEISNELKIALRHKFKTMLEPEKYFTTSAPTTINPKGKATLKLMFRPLKPPIEVLLSLLQSDSPPNQDLSSPTTEGRTTVAATVDTIKPKRNKSRITLKSTRRDTLKKKNKTAASPVEKNIYEQLSKKEMIKALQRFNKTIYMVKLQLYFSGVKLVGEWTIFGEIEFDPKDVTYKTHEPVPPNSP